MLDSTHSLIGEMFTTPKDLRHIAERTFCRLFVPTEVLAENARTMDIVLFPDGQHALYVHAERERHWYPFTITRVEEERQRLAS